MDVETLFRTYLKLEDYTPNSYYEEYEVFDENSIINIIEEFNLENVRNILLLILNNSKENSYILVDYIIHNYKLTEIDLKFILYNINFKIINNFIYFELELIFNRFNFVDFYIEFLIDLVYRRNILFFDNDLYEVTVCINVINTLIKNVNIPNYKDYILVSYFYYADYKYFYNYHDNKIEYLNKISYPFVEELIQYYLKYKNINKYFDKKIFENCNDYFFISNIFV